jgi:hypothetical protein
MIIKGLMGFGSLLAWLLLFMVGLTINSAPYRNALSAGTITAANVWMSLIAYTVTNAAILCLLSGMIGGIARIIMSEGSRNRGAGSPDQGLSAPGLLLEVSAGTLRGFAVYMLYVSGVYIGASDAFSNTTPEQYARVVATTSLLAFVVSYNPEVFLRVLGKFAPFGGEPKQDTKAGPRANRAIGA